MGTKEGLYDPLDYDNLTRNLVRELMLQEPHSLPLTKRFAGPGVYALFYSGNFKPYAKLCSTDSTEPIYVGKAILPGGRKGLFSGGERASLFGRIEEHSRSIQATKNLNIGDFRVRYLTVVPLWIAMAERFLIEHYQPLWNVCVEGFGLHDPGKGRHQGLIPWWDTLHPGRPWAAKLKQDRTAKAIEEKIAEFVRSRKKRKI